MTSPRNDLVEPEGVDAASAAGTAEGTGAPADATAASPEGDAGPEADRDLLGPPASAADAEDGATRAFPDDVRTPEETTGPGQQVQAGEG